MSMESERSDRFDIIITNKERQISKLTRKKRYLDSKKDKFEIQSINKQIRELMETIDNLKAFVQNMEE